MKFAAANAKCASYGEKHTIFIGCHTGSLKKIEVFHEDPFRQRNLQQVTVLDKTSKVTCMEYGNKQQTELLVGRANHYVKVLDCDSEQSVSNFEAGPGEVVGLGRSHECIVAGVSNGTVRIIKYPKPVEFSVGEDLAKLRLCGDDQNLMVTGGKHLKNILKVWDLPTQTVTFAAKNVRKDMLELEQPVWENDVLFLNRNLVASCSRHGYVRVYDLRGQQRRPVQGFSSTDPDDQLAFSCLASHGDYLYAGTTTVGARAFDTRKMNRHIHVYKGFTGTVTGLSIDSTGNHLFSSCLDRFVRVHHAQKTAIEFRCYVKSKPTQILGLEYVAAPVILDALEEDSDDDVVHISEQAQDEDVDPEYEEMFSKMQTVKETPKLKKRKADMGKSGYKKTKTGKQDS